MWRCCWERRVLCWRLVAELKGGPLEISGALQKQISRGPCCGFPPTYETMTWNQKNTASLKATLACRTTKPWSQIWYRAFPNLGEKMEKKHGKFLSIMAMISKKHGKFFQTLFFLHYDRIFHDSQTEFVPAWRLFSWTLATKKFRRRAESAEIPRFWKRGMFFCRPEESERQICLMILTLNPSAWNWWYAKSVRGFIGLDAQFRLNFINTQSHQEAGGRLALSTK